jgi:lipopolysaccharide export system protein LptA
MKKLSTVFFLFFLILYSNSPAFGQKEDQSHSTDITSDKMTYASRDNLVVFSGNVHVLRPDFELWSAELRVFLKPGQEGDSPGQQESIEKIVATGNVRIKSDGREGYSDLLTYFPDEGIARLEKNPRLVEDQNSVEGETIILNMTDNTSEVLGGPDKRVRVIFHSEPENQE